MVGCLFSQTIACTLSPSSTEKSLQVTFCMGVSGFRWRDAEIGMKF
jgi:hypothetical protein